MRKKIGKYIVPLMFSLLVCGSSAEAQKGVWQEAELIQEGAFTIVDTQYAVRKNARRTRMEDGQAAKDKESVLLSAYANTEKSVRKEACANAIYQGFINMTSSIDIYPYALNAEEVVEVYSDVVNTHPELFYAKRGYYKTTIDVEGIDETFVDTIYGFYKYEDDSGNPDVGTIQIMSTELEEKAAKILEALDMEGVSDTIKTVLIHDYLVSHTSYDYASEKMFGSNTAGYPDHDFTVYGALVNERAVCQGYSLAFKYLTNLAGISNTGFATSSYHMWNTITINNRNYYVDCTWDDGEGYDAFGYVGHAYLLKGTDVFTDHGDYETDRSVTTSVYDNCYWDSVYTKICKVGEEYYYMENGNIYVSTLPTEPGKLEFRTDVVETEEWTYESMSLDSKNTFLFYNKTDTIHSYNVKSKQNVMVGTISKSDTRDIHGFYIDGNTIRVGTKKTSTSPSDEVQTAQASEFDDNYFKNLVTKITAEDITMELSKVDGELVPVSVQLNVVVEPEYADNKNVTYVVENGDIARISQDGMITGLHPGTTTITIKSEDGNASKEIALTVLDKDSLLTEEVTTTEMPVMEESTTEIPTTEVPVTEEPTTEIPTTEVLITEEPVTEMPTTEVPVTEETVTDMLVTEEPTTEIPTTEVLNSTATKKNQFINGIYYDSDGNIANGIITMGGATFIFDNGKLATEGWYQVNNNIYYSESNGQVATGWKKIKDNKYYFAENGVRLTGFQKIQKHTYYFDSNGVMRTGFVKVNKKTYYMDKAGAMQFGFVKVKKKTYYMNKNGVMKTGFVKVNKKTYYMNKKGVMQTGWKKIKGKKYYFNKKGVMQTGKRKINGKTYIFDSKGRLQK